MSKLTYYFFSWDEDKDFINELMTKQWLSLGLNSTGKPDVDYDVIRVLYDSGKILALVGKDSEGNKLSYFVGALEKSLYQKDKIALNQISVALDPKVKGIREYINLIETVEKVAKKMGANIMNINIESQKAVPFVSKKLGYSFNDIELVKEIV